MHRMHDLTKRHMMYNVMIVYVSRALTRNTHNIPTKFDNYLPLNLHH